MNTTIGEAVNLLNTSYVSLQCNVQGCWDSLACAYGCAMPEKALLIYYSSLITKFVIVLFSSVILAGLVGYKRESLNPMFYQFLTALSFVLYVGSFITSLLLLYMLRGVLT